jgi:hypothetical protein
MTERMQEAVQPTIRLLKCTLEVAHCRAYWDRAGREPVTARAAFSDYWFGARSFERVQLLLANMRCRFHAFPPALEVLHGWPDMSADTRQVICHWHLQLADALYRRFTGDFLVVRREDGRGEITRDVVVGWLGSEGPNRWTMSTRTQYASKLLTAARAAGLVSGNRDPRRLILPRVPPDALAYLVYLLRGIRFAGTLLDNPYLASVGLRGPLLETRLRELPWLDFRKQGSLVDFGWHHGDLQAWARARLRPDVAPVNGGVA